MTIDTTADAMAAITEPPDARLARVKAAVDAVLSPTLVVGEPGHAWLRVATAGDRHIDLLPMLLNTRVVETPVSDPPSYGRFWCFESPTLAALAVAAWGVEGHPADGEPAGWVKAWCECRHGEHVCGGRRRP